MLNMSSPTTVHAWIRDTADTLADAMIPSARLDAELILAYTLRKDRTWLHAHGDEQLDERTLERLDARLTMRLERTPIAYITGAKEFYGRNFMVNPSVLIPRPESEDLITLLLEWKRSHPRGTNLVDVGSGSGCLGISAKLELPELTVTLCDIDERALAVAQENSSKLQADVATLHSDLLRSYPLKADVIAANLPYVDRLWDVSPETAHEPEVALFADDEGLELIYRLIDQSKDKLNAEGILLLESDLRQHDDITSYTYKSDLTLVKSLGLIQLFQKN